MTNPAALPNLAFYSTPAYACNYLPGRQAVTMFADPIVPKDETSYAILSSYGFRRSGEHLYRPRCPDCSACVPVRVNVAEFTADRRQRRTLRDNQDVQVWPNPPSFRGEHFSLYKRYLKARHAGGGMDDATPESYMSFLTSSWATTCFYEMRVDGMLAAVAVADHMRDSLSAVYTFFEPSLAQRSLGRFAVLYQIEEARRLSLRWVYLGYWIAGCRKMSYKNEYQPIEYYREGTWSSIRPSAD